MVRYRTDDDGEQVPEALFDELVLQYGAGAHGDVEDDWVLDREAPFLLIERVVERFRDGHDYWLTSHPTAEAAAKYHDGQEYSEDWQIEVLVHLPTGDRYQPVQTTTWTLESAGGAAQPAATTNPLAGSPYDDNGRCRYCGGSDIHSHSCAWQSAALVAAGG